MQGGHLGSFNKKTRGLLTWAAGSRPSSHYHFKPGQNLSMTNHARRRRARTDRPANLREPDGRGEDPNAAAGDITAARSARQADYRLT